MNNKILKRVVAAASCVAMLGTCAFATELKSATFADGTLSFTYDLSSEDGKTQEKLTYLAYAATEAKDGDTNVKTIGDVTYALGNIVAVNQLDSDLDGDEEAVISSELLGNAPYIVLLSGDDLGSTVAEAAVPTVTKYTVSFEIAAELGLTAPTAIETTTGKATLPEAPAKDGYTFDGWYLEATPETLVAAGTEVDVAGDVKYIAKYTVVPADETYTVTFMSEGSEYATADSEKGVVTLPEKAPTKSGTYRFAGWYVDDEYTVVFDENNVTADITVYAKFKPYYLRGDVNLDGKITSADYTDILKKFKRQTPVYLTGQKVTLDSGTQYTIGDVDDSKSINANDYTNVLKKFKRQTPTYPVLTEVE